MPCCERGFMNIHTYKHTYIHTYIHTESPYIVICRDRLVVEVPGCPREVVQQWGSSMTMMDLSFLHIIEEGLISKHIKKVDVRIINLIYRRRCSHQGEDIQLLSRQMRITGYMPHQCLVVIFLYTVYIMTMTLISWVTILGRRMW